MAHKEPNTANRQRVEGFTQVATGQGKWLQGRDPVTQETPELTLGRHWPVLGISRSVGPRASRPCTALPSHLGEAGGGEAFPCPLTGASRECSSHGITWNWSCVGEKQQFSESGMGLGGAAVCWGGFFLSVVLNNVYNLPQSLL